MSSSDHLGSISDASSLQIPLRSLSLQVRVSTSRSTGPGRPPWNLVCCFPGGCRRGRQTGLCARLFSPDKAVPSQENSGPRTSRAPLRPYSLPRRPGAGLPPCTSPPSLAPFLGRSASPGTSLAPALHRSPGPGRHLPTPLPSARDQKSHCPCSRVSQRFQGCAVSTCTNYVQPASHALGESPRDPTVGPFKAGPRLGGDCISSRGERLSSDKGFKNSVESHAHVAEEENVPRLISHVC